MALLVLNITALGCSAAAVSLALASTVAAATATRPTEGPVEAVLFSVACFAASLPMSRKELPHSHMPTLLQPLVRALGSLFVPAEALTVDGVPGLAAVVLGLGCCAVIVLLALAATTAAFTVAKIFESPMSRTWLLLLIKKLGFASSLPGFYICIHHSYASVLSMSLLHSVVKYQ